MTAQESTLWYLKKINLFAGLSDQDLEYVKSCFTNRWYEKNKELPLSTQPGQLYLVKDGVVELNAITQDGRKIIVDLLGGGSIFGNVVPNGEFDFNARVRKKSLVCMMSVDRFFEMVSKYPDVAEKLMRILYTDISRQQERISSLASETVVQRLLRLMRVISIRELAQKHKVNITHEELAQMVGTSRQTITTLLKNLEKEGKVRKMEGKYELVG